MLPLLAQPLSTGLSSLNAARCSLQGLRSISEEQINASSEAVADLFQRALDKATRKRNLERPAILTTRREALSLYREILRYSNLFMWRDDKGNLFRDLIRESARKEYEDARYEPDPEIVSKLIITGRESVQRAVESFVKKRQELIDQQTQQPPRGLY